MNNVKAFEEKYIDSREVAEMVGKEHKNLMRSIRLYVSELNQLKIEPVEFFRENTYTDDKGEKRPCYFVTKRGCEFIAHKLTGIKGTEFTARYIKRFHEMENIIQGHIPQGKELLALAVLEAQKTIQELNGQKQELIHQVNVKEQIIGELKPKADYTDMILRNKGLVTITQIAKDYGMTGTEMNKKLHELGIQYRQSEQWLLYKEYQGLGYTHSETVEITRADGRPDIKMNTKWTQKGRLFIYDKLKVEGILPIIERNT